MSYLGFKVISSQASFCSKKFQISNIWNGRAEYSKQLYKKHNKLKKCNTKDLYQLVNELFFDKNSYYGINSIDKVFKKFISKKHSKVLFKNNKLNFQSKVFYKIEEKNNYKIAKKLSQNINF